MFLNENLAKILLILTWHCPEVPLQINRYPKYNIKRPSKTKSDHEHITLKEVEGKSGFLLCKLILLVRWIKIKRNNYEVF